MNEVLHLLMVVEVTPFCVCVERVPSVVEFGQ